MKVKYKYYVLVSQGIEIFRTTFKEEAERIMKESNEEFYNYKQRCLDNHEDYADTEVFMYEEEVIRCGRLD